LLCLTRKSSFNAEASYLFDLGSAISVNQEIPIRFGAASMERAASKGQCATLLNEGLGPPKRLVPVSDAILVCDGSSNVILDNWENDARG
jgi:hypothetical protein